MNEQPVVVGLGEHAVRSNTREVLVAYGLGSCIGVCMYDPRRRTAGLLHAVLPYRTYPDAPQGRFVDTGIPLLLGEMLGEGAQAENLQTYLVGGATMLPQEGEELEALRIGKRNIAVAREVLDQLGLSISGEAVGGTAGRTVRLYVETGELMLRALGNREQPISTFVGEHGC